MITDLGAEAAANSPFLMPSERDMLEFTADGTTRHMDKFTARLLLLNFILTKTLVPHLAGVASPVAAINGSDSKVGKLGAAKSAAGKLGGLVGKPQFDNRKMIATVVYWVARCGMIRDETNASLHPGDPAVLADLYPDQATGDSGGYAHVRDELMRQGWLEKERNRMWEICDKIYERSLLLGSAAERPDSRAGGLSGE